MGPYQAFRILRMAERVIRSTARAASRRGVYRVPRGGDGRRLRGGQVMDIVLLSLAVVGLAFMLTALFSRPW